MCARRAPARAAATLAIDPAFMTRVQSPGIGIDAVSLPLAVQNIIRRLIVKSPRKHDITSSRVTDCGTRITTVVIHSNIMNSNSLYTGFQFPPGGGAGPAPRGGRVRACIDELVAALPTETDVQLYHVGVRARRRR